MSATAPGSTCASTPRIRQTCVAGCGRTGRSAMTAQPPITDESQATPGDAPVDELLEKPRRSEDMADRFHPISMEQLHDWVFDELEHKASPVRRSRVGLLRAQ